MSARAAQLQLRRVHMFSQLEQPMYTIKRERHRPTSWLQFTLAPPFFGTYAFLRDITRATMKTNKEAHHHIRYRFRLRPEPAVPFLNVERCPPPPRPPRLPFAAAAPALPFFFCCAPPFLLRWSFLRRRSTTLNLPLTPDGRPTRLPTCPFFATT